MSPIRRDEIADRDPVLETQTLETQTHAEREDVGPAGAETVAHADEERAGVFRGRRLREELLETAPDELVGQTLLAGAGILRRPQRVGVGGAGEVARDAGAAQSGDHLSPQGAADRPEEHPRALVHPHAAVRRVDEARQPLIRHRAGAPSGGAVPLHGVQERLDAGDVTGQPAVAVGLEDRVRIPVAQARRRAAR